MRKKLLIAVCLLLIFIGLRWSAAFSFSRTKYHLIHDQLISDLYFSSINDAVISLLNEGYSDQQIIEHLKKEFSVLSKIIIIHKPFSTRVIVYTKKPTYYINGSLVLTSTNEIFSNNFFSQQAIEHIPHITVSSDLIKNYFFISKLLQKMPKDCNENYNLELVHEHTVRFNDKSQPNFIIVVSAEQDNFSYVLAQCDLIKKNIDERKGFNKGIRWVADARFAHYIVVYRE